MIYGRGIGVQVECMASLATPHFRPKLTVGVLERPTFAPVILFDPGLVTIPSRSALIWQVFLLWSDIGWSAVPGTSVFISDVSCPRFFGRET